MGRLEANPENFKKKPEKFQDLTSIIAHEIVHAMSVAHDIDGGWTNSFKELTLKRNRRRYFAGANAMSVYGNQVALTTVGSADHIKLDSTAKKQWTIMGEWGNYDISWRTPTDLDFAILKDIGWNVV